eukprot:3782969-Amphidinium_carterae.1
MSHYIAPVLRNTTCLEVDLSAELEHWFRHCLKGIAALQTSCITLLGVCTQHPTLSPPCDIIRQLPMFELHELMRLGGVLQGSVKLDKQVIFKMTFLGPYPDKTLHMQAPFSPSI